MCTEILFHALGAGVVMDPDDTIRALNVETKSGRAAVIAASSSMLRRREISPPGPARHTSAATATAACSNPTMMFRLNGVDPAAAGEAWTTSRR